MKNKQTLIRAALLLALTIPLMAASCGNRTTTHKIAVFTAQADAALIGFTDAVDLLQRSGKIQDAKGIYNLNLRVAIALDTIRNRAETGFNKKEALEIIKQVIADARAAEAAGLIGLTGTQRQKFQEVTFFAIFTLESIQAVIAATKEPAPPPTNQVAAAASGRAGARQAEDTTWTELVLILQKAVLTGIGQSRMNQVDAFADGRRLSAELQASLRAKLGT